MAFRHHFLSRLGHFLSSRLLVSAPGIYSSLIYNRFLRPYGTHHPGICFAPTVIRMAHNSICRIGVFYDGSYFTYARRYFFFNRKLGWLNFPAFHYLLESFVGEREQHFSTFRVVYAAWYQGLFTSVHATEEQLKFQRNLDQDLIHAGIELKYEPMSQSQEEKGVDVAMAIDALAVALQGRIDVAVLVTGDGDFVPLARALMNQGIRVVSAYFEYEDEADRSFINERLRNACNYALSITALEKDPHQQSMFRDLFRQSNKQNGLDVRLKAVR